MERLYVLYDARCGLCRWAKAWAMEQPAFFSLIFIEAGSDEALLRFPGLSRPGVPEELIAVSDEGAIYRNDSAWIMCLYALEDYREWSLQLSRPLLRPLARQAFTLISRNRSWISRHLGSGDEALYEVLKRVEAPACELNSNVTPLKIIATLNREEAQT